MTDLYLYQTLHLLRGRVRLLDRHVALLDRCSAELFGRRYTPDLRQLERRIAATAAAHSTGGVCSSFVRLEWRPDGSERLLPAGNSYYEGYALRSVRPRGLTVAGEPPLGGYPTPAREAAALTARQLALRAGAAVAVLTGADGSYRTAEGSPLAALHDRTLWLTPECAPCLLPPGGTGADGQPLPGRCFPAVPSVEYGLLAEAARAAGYAVEARPFGPAELPQIDELLWLDHRGITALSHIDGRPLLALAAERIAEALEKRFSKR